MSRAIKFPAILLCLLVAPILAPASEAGGAEKLATSPSEESLSYVEDVTVLSSALSALSTASAGSAGGLFNALTPARILDTRPAPFGPIGVPAAGKVGPGSTISVQVAGVGGVPASGVSAVVLNATVTGPTSGSFLTVYPSGVQRPVASNLNFSPGQTVPNLIAVKLGSNGKVDVFNAVGTTDVIFDIAGWYTTEASCLGKGASIVGTPGNDVIAGTSGDDVIVTFGGDDVVNAGDGNDDICAGDGADTVSGGNGADFVWGHGGNDTLKGDAGNDSIVGDLGNDSIDGGAGELDFAFYVTAPSSVRVDLANGTATGGDGTDTLVGVEGVFGSFGNDTLIGDGNANFFLDLRGDDNFDGGDGFDLIFFIGSVQASLVTNLSTGAVDGNDRLAGMEGLVALGAGSTLAGDSAPNLLMGLSGNNSINGGAGEDILLGGAGQDTLRGDEGNDFLRGGRGSDTLNGGAGDLDVASYDDSTAGVQANLATGTVTTPTGTDVVAAIEGLEGSNFSDNLSGDGLANLLSGVAGNDTISGLGGADVLHGGPGNDSVSGGTENDFLDGEDGVDGLDGGLGDDSCFNGENVVNCETVQATPGLPGAAPPNTSVDMGGPTSEPRPSDEGDEPSTAATDPAPFSGGTTAPTNVETLHHVPMTLFPWPECWVDTRLYGSSGIDIFTPAGVPALNVTAGTDSQRVWYRAYFYRWIGGTKQLLATGDWFYTDLPEGYESTEYWRHYPTGVLNSWVQTFNISREDDPNAHFVELEFWWYQNGVQVHYQRIVPLHWNVDPIYRYYCRGGLLGSTGANRVNDAINIMMSYR